MNDDYVANGFYKIDPKAIRNNPPRIRWTAKWHERTDASKLLYLEKLARSMNHAAKLLEGERDELAKLCELKEGQLQSLKAAMEQNMMMLQSEVTRMNEQRQEYHENIRQLTARIRQLEANGNHD